MKKKDFVLAASFSLFILAVSASAQTASFAGTWTLDVSKSKLGDHNMIEAQTLTVTQTDKDITIATATKRLPPPADFPQGGGMGGGRPGGGMGGMMGGQDGTRTYNLDGKEAKSEVQGPRGSMPVSTKAELKSGKLHISTTSTFNGPMGEVSITSKEAWELSADGKTLTINTDRTTMRGNETTTKVFAMKQ
jgi:hypothetical protein